MKKQSFRRLAVLTLLIVFGMGLTGLAGLHGVKATGTGTATTGPAAPTIEASNMTGYSKMAAANYLAYFKPNSDSARAIMFENNGYNVSIDISTSQMHYCAGSTYSYAIIGMATAMNPLATSLSVSGTTATYANAWTNTNLIFNAYDGELKETLVNSGVYASESPTLTSYLEYAENLYYNSTLAMYTNGVHEAINTGFTTQGQISFNNANNATEFYLPTPTVYDSAGNTVLGTYLVYASSNANGIVEINILVPISFINSAVFPIYIDPTLETGSLGTFTMPQSGSVTQFDYSYNCNDWPGVQVSVGIYNSGGGALWTDSGSLGGSSSGSGSFSVSPNLAVTGGVVYQLGVVVTYSVFGTYYQMSGTAADIDYIADSLITITSNPTGSGFIQVDGVGYSTPAGFSWLPGSTHTIAANSPVSGGSGTQYLFSSWSDSGAQSHTYTVPSSSATVTANFQTQYYLTVASSYGTTSGSGWYNVGATAYAGLNVGVQSAGSGAQYAFSSWSTGGTNYAQSSAITMNAPMTASANWVTQYYLTVSSAYDSPSGAGWYNQGSSANFAVSSPISGGSGIQYAFSSWAGSGSGYYSGSSASASCTMNAAITETASWTTQYQVTFSQSGLDSTAQGTIVTVNGNGENYAALPYQVWVNSGSPISFSYTATVSSSTTGKQFTLSSESASSPYTVNAAATIIGGYGTQFYLTVTSSYGSPTGQGWVNSGAQGSFSVTTPFAGAAGVQYVFSAWTGTGSGYYSGSTASESVTMNNPITETASWTTQYQVTFAVSGMDSSSTGTVCTVNSATKTYVQLPFSLWVNSGGSVTFSFSSTVSSSNTGESFSLQSVSASSPLTVNAAQTVSGSYTVQVNGGGGSASLTLKTIDKGSNMLASTVISLNGTQYSTGSGQLTVTGLTSGNHYVGSVTWNGVTVNATFAVTLSGSSTTLNVRCHAYPYTVSSAVYEFACSRAVSSAVFNGTSLTVAFGASSVTNNLACSCPATPTYVSGVAYALSTDYSGGVFSDTLANTTAAVSVNFESWGSGFYVAEADTPLASLSWNGLTLTFNFMVNGTGTLVLSCGSYGVPVTVTGMTGAYNSATAVLTGYYSGVSSVVVSWATTGGGGGSGGGSGSSSSGGSVSVSPQNFGSVTAGSNQTETLTFTFTSSDFNVQSVQFTGNGAAYVSAVDLPMTFYGGEGQVTVILDVPADAAGGSYTLTATLTGLDASGTQHQATGPVSFTVTGSSSQLPGFTWTSNEVAFGVVVIVLVVTIVGALSVMNKRKI